MVNINKLGEFMNKKLKKITAILMSALIISSVTTLTACTDASSNDKNKTTETTSNPSFSADETKHLPAFLV